MSLRHHQLPSTTIKINNNFFILRQESPAECKVTFEAIGGGFNTTAATFINLRSDNSSAAACYEFVYFKDAAERFTSDDGGVYAFRLKLRNEPTAPVYLKLRSDKPGIGNPNRTGITLADQLELG